MSWCLLSAFTLLTSVTGTGRYSAFCQKRKGSITPAKNPLTYNTVQHERWASIALSCGTNQSISSWISSPFCEMEPNFDIALVAKNLRLNRSETQENPNTTLLVLQEHSNKMTPLALLVGQCLVQPSSVKIPSAVEGKNIQWPTLSNIHSLRDLRTLDPK